MPLFRTVMTRRFAVLAFALSVLVVATFEPAFAEFTQQGGKLSTNYCFGGRISLSGDGDTAVVSSCTSTGGFGNVWVYQRSGGVWTAVAQLKDSTGTDLAYATSVAMAADGSTLVVGIAPQEGAYVYVRSGTTWVPQGPKLAGVLSSVEAPRQGESVAISADGGTVLVGAPNYSFHHPQTGQTVYFGAAFAFKRSGTNWGAADELSGRNYIGSAHFGRSVGLSADGARAAVGGDGDNSNVGAVWTFARDCCAWTFVSKLVGADASYSVQRQGGYVSISADGMRIASGSSYGSSAGLFVFKLNGANYLQEGLLSKSSFCGYSVSMASNGERLLSGYECGDGKSASLFTRTTAGAWTLSTSLTTPDNSNNSGQSIPSRVALSGNGRTAWIGSPSTDCNAQRSLCRGGAWVFAEPASPASRHDYDSDDKSDVLWREAGGAIQLWLMDGLTPKTSLPFGNVAPNWKIVGQRDLNGDGRTDLLWREDGGSLVAWLMTLSADAPSVSARIGDSTSYASSALVSSYGAIPPNWVTVGIGDLNGDGTGDLVWRSSNGDAAAWLMVGGQPQVVSFGNVSPFWTVAVVADFTGDGKADILWRDGDGAMVVWVMNGSQVSAVVPLGTVSPTWTIVGPADFDGDGKVDLLWRDNAGYTALWMMNSLSVTSVYQPGQVPADWSVAQIGDYNGDKRSDILWRHAGGQLATWFMNGGTISTTGSGGTVPANWKIESTNAH